MVVTSSSESERCESIARPVFGAAVAISVLMHIGALLWLDARDAPERTSFSPMPLQILLVPPAVQPAPVSLVDPQPMSEPPQLPVKKHSVKQHSVKKSPARELPAKEPPHGEHAQASPVPAKTAVPPPQVSILQRVDDYVANMPLSSEYLPTDTKAESGNIFHPTLRRALREQGGRADDSLKMLNDSTVVDAYERVSLDGKCFRLEDLGGGGGKRAWYPIKCKGSESTSDAMARGLEEALERR